MKSPRENPADRAARERERRLSELEQGQTDQQTAAGMTSDLRAIYGLRKLKNLAPSALPGVVSAGGANAQAMANFRTQVATMTSPSYKRPLAYQNGQNK